LSRLPALVVLLLLALLPVPLHPLAPQQRKALVLPQPVPLARLPPALLPLALLPLALLPLALLPLALLPLALLPLALLLLGVPPPLLMLH
jgi:hypothetical protein